MTTVASDPAGVSLNNFSRVEETRDEVVIATIDKREPLVTRRVSIIVGLHLSEVLISGPGIVELLLYVPSPKADHRISLSSPLCYLEVYYNGDNVGHSCSAHISTCLI